MKITGRSVFKFVSIIATLNLVFFLLHGMITNKLDKDILLFLITSVSAAWIIYIGTKKHS